MLPKNPLISVIVLNWNGKRFLKDCFLSLENQVFSDFEIILVDNGSEDDSVRFTRKNFPKIKIIENKENLGFAQGNNKGMEVAEGKYVFILNNDTEVDKNCLQELLRVIEEDKEIGMCGPKILSLKNPQLIDSAGINIYSDGMSRGRARGEADKGQYNKIEEILLPSGCAALYRKKMLDEIGLFDKDFFAYCEDTDLGLRGRLMGWKAVLVPFAVVYHYYSGTSGKYSSFKAFLVERNHFWVVLKNFPLFLVFCLPLFTFYRYLFLFYGILTRRGPGARFQSSKFNLPFIVIKSYFSMIKRLPVVLKQRRAIQKNKKISNKEMYNLFKKYKLKISEITFKE